MMRGEERERGEGGSNDSITLTKAHNMVENRVEHVCLSDITDPCHFLRLRLISEREREKGRGERVAY